MLLNSDSLKHKKYGFRFKGVHQHRVAGIYSLGWEKQTKTTYDWDGLTRSEKDLIVFQYTLKGLGKIRVKDQTFDLKTGEAFFVKIPSDHRYYLPPHSKEWEFIHITLFGTEAIRCYEEITNDNGHVLNLDRHSTPITQVFDMLKKVSTQKISDAYEASALAYAFLMELHRYRMNIETNNKIPESIANAIHFIESNYANFINLTDIVDASGLSKYHFTRLFHKTIHSTPIQYLTKVRINKSIELLQSEDLTMEEIASQVGFSNGNYYGKVFRSSIGISPGEYRNNKSFMALDHFIGD